MAHNDGGILRFRVEALGGEQVAHNLHSVLILEGDFFYGHLVALVEVVSPIRHVSSH
ncbi:hypothetical protein D3C75_810140 [compost metagenome]